MSVPVKSERALAHTAHIPVRWGDMDAMGHVNNTVYFRYMEQARIDWLTAASANLGSEYRGQGPVIVSAACTFKEPVTYPGDVEVRLYFGRVGRSSVESFYDILKDGRVHAEGEAKIVWLDLRSGKPVPLPDPLRDTFKAEA
jgi:acyl-CoA thioester hydrolase